MSHVKPPQMLVDLYRDLRDRRLLVPAIALLVAVVAVPVVLAKDAPVPAPPPPMADTGKAKLSEPTVFAANTTEVRDFRQRLDEFKSKNPFDQQFTIADIGPGDEVTVTDPAGDVTVDSGGGSVDTGTVDATGDATVDSTTTDTSTGSGSSSDGSGSSGGGDQVNPPPDPEPVVLARRLNVKVGPVGAVELQKNVSSLDILPGLAHPVVFFLGTSESGEKAAFAVSSDVASTAGDGTCVPSPASCDYLLLEEGQEQTFDYTPEGVTYSLKLLRIRTVELEQ